MNNRRANDRALAHLTVSELCHSVSVGIVITPAKYYAEFGVRAFRSLNVKPDRISDERWVFLSEEGHRLHSKSTLRTGDVLIVRSGEPGVACVVTKEYDGCNCIDLVITRPNRERVLPQYLSYYLNSDVAKKNIQSVQGGLAQKHLNVSAVNKLRVPLPSLPEQQKIAAVLSTWDRAIELTEKLITAKQKRKQALMQQLFTGKVRFTEFVKSNEVFSTRYGTYPKDWKYVRLENVAEEVSERNADGTNHKVLSCTKYDGLVDSLTYFGKQIFSDDLSTYRVVRRGHFAYATNHIEEGSIGYQNICDIAVVSPIYTVFKTTDDVDDGFLYKLLKSNLYVHIYQVNTSASVDRRGSLRWEAFSHIRIPLPSPAEQRAIAAVLDQQQAELNVLAKKCEALRQQKKGLMQRLLTGKIRVNAEDVAGK